MSGARRCLVTGGAGYVGEHLVQGLLARGDQVKVLDLARPPSDDVEWLEADIRDPRAVAAACRGMDLVIHAVAQVPLQKRRDLLWTVNVAGADNLLAGARAHAVPKVLMLSSSAVYGVPERCPVTRETLAQPVEAYGRAKLEADRLSARYAAEGLDVSIVRPRTVLGHGRLGIFQILFERVRRGQPLFLLGSGENRYQFVHVSDLVDLCLRAAQRPGPALYLSGAAEFGTMRQLLEHLVLHAQSPSPIFSLPAKTASRLMQLTGRLRLSPLSTYHALLYGEELFFDIQDGVRELGVAPTWSNAQMIAHSYDYYLEHRLSILHRASASHHRSALAPGILRALSWPPGTR